MSKEKIYKISQYILKLLVSGFAVWLIVRMFGKDEILSSIKKNNPILILLAVVLYLLSQIISTLRLGWILRRIDINITPFENFKLYLIGMAYNLFLPGGIGGDGYKLIIYKNQYKVSGKKIFKALILERLLGLISIFILLAIIGTLNSFRFPFKAYFFILAPLIYLISYIILVRIFSIFKPVIHKGIFISLLIQVIQIFSLLSLSSGFGINKWIDISGIFLVSSLATAIPVFLGGVGAREIVFGLLADKLDMNHAEVVSMAILFSIITLLSCLPGLVLIWSNKRNIQT